MALTFLGKIQVAWVSAALLRSELELCWMFRGGPVHSPIGHGLGSIQVSPCKLAGSDQLVEEPPLGLVEPFGPTSTAQQSKRQLDI